MKNLILLISLLFSISALAHWSDHSVQSEPRECFNSTDLEDFKTRWTITSIIEFQMGHVFCKVAMSDETDKCAAQSAMTSNNVIELLSSYHQGTESCSLQIIESCSSWCVSFIENEEFCRSKCQLPNFHPAL